MRVVFMGTPDFSVPVLNSLVLHGIEILLVISQPDKQVGRGRKVKYTSVKEAALKHNLQVFQPDDINAHVEIIKELEPDLIITCAYGQILSRELLDCAKIKAINVHASLLPKHRGGAPIHRAILNGDRYSGVTIMEMVEKMDSGNIFLQDKVEILKSDTLASLHNKLAILGSRLIVEAIPEIVSGVAGVVQDESQVTYSPNISKEERTIDFNSCALQIFNKVRAFNPFPCAQAKYDEMFVKIYEVVETTKKSNEKPGTIVSITKAGIEVCTSDFNVLITKLQMPNKKQVSAEEFINGNKILKVDTAFS